MGTERDRGRLWIPRQLLSTVRSHPFSDSCCFLCGRELTPQNRADEHVVPKWAQDRYRLWDQHLVLLNRTDIPYRQLTIPCCYECNNCCLQPIEQEISRAVQEGVTAVSALDPLLLFLWLGKIFFGLAYKELFLTADRAVAASPTITNPKTLRAYELQHLFLQSARVDMEFVDCFPASILLFETKVPSDPCYQWYLADNPVSMFICCRMGSVGIVADLKDGGFQGRLAYHHLDEYRGMALHPLQFLELGAMVCYKSLLLSESPEYEIEETLARVQVRRLPSRGLYGKPAFKPWDQHEYAKVLAAFTGFPLEMLFTPPDKVVSWLRGEDGRVRHIGFESQPWPP